MTYFRTSTFETFISENVTVMDSLEAIAVCDLAFG